MIKLLNDEERLYKIDSMEHITSFPSARLFYEMISEVPHRDQVLIARYDTDEVRDILQLDYDIYGEFILGKVIFYDYECDNPYIIIKAYADCEEYLKNGINNIDLFCKTMLMQTNIAGYAIHKVVGWELKGLERGIVDDNLS